MPRKYYFADVNTDEKPSITKCARTFGDTTYHWRCAGRASEGFGFTPTHAYKAWEKNWKRRFKFYESKERYARTFAYQPAVSRKKEKPLPEPVNNRVCNYCGCGGLHWVETERGWRLYETDDTQHKCY